MLELYQAEGCTYSQKVRETLTDLGLSYVIHNPRSARGEVRNDQTHDHLLNRRHVSRDRIFEFLLTPR